MAKKKLEPYSPEKRRIQYINNIAGEMLCSARTRAKKLKIPFTITRTDIQEMLDSTPVCPILRVKLEVGHRGDCSLAPSLDRKNNKDGYTKDNCWVISKKANTIKNNSNSAERVLFAIHILNTHKNNLLKRKYELLELIETHLLPLLKKNDEAKKDEEQQGVEASYKPVAAQDHWPVSDVELKGLAHLSEMG